MKQLAIIVSVIALSGLYIIGSLMNETMNISLWNHQSKQDILAASILSIVLLVGVNLLGFLYNKLK